MLLSLLALDVHRRDRSFQADDVLFRVGSLRDDRWQPTEIVPFGAARAVLGVDDDLAYRRALQLVRRAHPRNVTYEQSKLVESSRGRPDPARRRRTAGRRRRTPLGGGEPPRRARALRSPPSTIRCVRPCSATLPPTSSARSDSIRRATTRNTTSSSFSTHWWRRAEAGRSGPRAAAPSTRVQGREADARGQGTDVEIQFLAPLAGAIAVLGVVPLVASLGVVLRATRVRSRLGLRSPTRRSRLPVLAALVVVPVLVGLAAAEPVIARGHVRQIRVGAEALFVVDTSRSMLARPSERAPTRLARAKESRACAPLVARRRPCRDRVDDRQDASPPTPVSRSGRVRIGPRPVDRDRCAASVGALHVPRDRFRRARGDPHARVLLRVGRDGGSSSSSPTVSPARSTPCAFARSSAATGDRDDRHSVLERSGARLHERTAGRRVPPGPTVGEGGCKAGGCDRWNGL